MKKTWILLGLALLFLVPTTYAYQNEPDGFRGIKWETPVDSVPGLTYITTVPGIEEITTYVRLTDDLKVGGAKADNIGYHFWKGRFYMGTMILTGRLNFNRLKESLEFRFGNGVQPNEYEETYYWFGIVTEIILQYKPIRDVTNLFMNSVAIDEEIKDHERKNAVKGEGF